MSVENEKLENYLVHSKGFSIGDHKRHFEIQPDGRGYWTLYELKEVSSASSPEALFEEVEKLLD